MITAEALEGKLDPIIGRENEIERIIQILSRRTKNNPCLIGEPGVGKTAVVEGLSERIMEGNVSETLNPVIHPLGKDSQMLVLHIHFDSNLAVPNGT